MFIESKRFIEEHIDLIDKNDFNDFYNHTEGVELHFIGGITRLLLDSGIDPLTNLNYIPAAYLYDCVVGETFNIPSHIKVIDQCAFSGTEITHIEIPEGVQIIETQAFGWNDYLHTVILPKSLKQIEADTFEGCMRLHEIKYNGTRDQFRQIRCSSKLINSFNTTKNTLHTIICSDGEVSI